jgi:SAM-dependent methyltransferase
MDWRTFWNEDHAIYVSARHRLLHADLVARGLVAQLPPGGPRVLDWGCGEAEAATFVAARCSVLYLYDGAPRVHANLRRRYVGESAIAVLDEDALSALPDRSLDAIGIVSVVQYLSREALDSVLASLAPKLAENGRLIIADVIPPGLSPLVDARALLTFGWRGGFFRDAVLGLVKTFFSNYRTLRATLGLTQWSEEQMLALLRRHGFAGKRAATNIGHNQARMTFVGEGRYL